MTTFPMPTYSGDQVLVASPSSAVRQRVLESLQPRARLVKQTSGGAEALSHLEKGPWQVLFLDRRLPDLDAEELSKTVRQRYPEVEVVLLDSDRESETSPTSELQPPILHTPWTRAESAAYEYGYEKTGRIHEERLESRRAEESIPQSATLPAVSALPGMIGRANSMRPLFRMAALVAPRDTTVLITGPTGSGKELVARALHQLSPRASHTFAVVNCAAIPETLLEAELFGYSRGAFTGALQSYAGRIQAAHLGTLFLDEIGEMPLSLQPKLLRFLEQKELQRLGSSQVVRVDTRVVSATNVDLRELVREGKFREDLYYRLSAFPLSIPPLRERPEDIMALASHFLDKFTTCPPASVLSDAAQSLLESHGWPGNVRELQNVIERALILADGQRYILPSHLMLTDSGCRANSLAQ
jgi:DNA-binding NtrC family response regulator